MYKFIQESPSGGDVRVLSEVTQEDEFRHFIVCPEHVLHDDVLRELEPEDQCLVLRWNALGSATHCCIGSCVPG